MITVYSIQYSQLCQFIPLTGKISASFKSRNSWRDFKKLIIISLRRVSGLFFLQDGTFLVHPKNEKENRVKCHINKWNQHSRTTAMLLAIVLLFWLCELPNGILFLWWETHARSNLHGSLDNDSPWPDLWKTVCVRRLCPNLNHMLLR